MSDRYRVGRSLGRTIYRQIGDEPSKDDDFLGIMDTRALASLVVDALNGESEVRADERERYKPMMKALSEELLNARAEERERIAAAIEAVAESVLPLSPLLRLLMDRRADERERMAAAIERLAASEPRSDMLQWRNGLVAAARIARNGGGDE